ncbi:MAG: DUF1997 domain-containing protein [Oscillatoria sp. PMC 1068.18]|nr:DUF1997 domain-containing protein [Oscillatoria sp. PMC 1076.18]MEC4988375.1 DUF1997 domain-containing protein [Oscillatoria sp. PMC 1068.18]
MAVKEQSVPIQHYLRQPQRLVRAIANPELMNQLSESYFRLKMRPLNFLDLYHFQPTVLLKVWSAPDGTVHLKSQDCEIRGIEYINDRFFLKVEGQLYPKENNGSTYLQGKADLEVNVELPPPLWLTPRPILETAGNGLLKSVLLRIKQRLVSQLLEDYRLWADNNLLESTKTPSQQTLSAAENPTA